MQCGGIGLNLTAASHVVHFDRLYNPAKEAQATDRCHRLGQRRAVCVHRLVTEGTYEERLEEIMQRKQDLSSLTVTRAEDWISDYDDAALYELFTLRSGGRGAGRGGGGAGSSGDGVPGPRGGAPEEPRAGAPQEPRASASRALASSSLDTGCVVDPTTPLPTNCRPDRGRHWHG